MDNVKICPTCKEAVIKTPLVDVLVTFETDLTGNFIYEQSWHRACYPPAQTPAALVAALRMAYTNGPQDWLRDGHAVGDAIRAALAGVASEGE